MPDLNFTASPQLGPYLCELGPTQGAAASTCPAHREDCCRVMMPFENYQLQTEIYKPVMRCQGRTVRPFTFLAVLLAAELSYLILQR